MAQEPTLQTVIDLITRNKVDADQKFEDLTEIMVSHFDKLDKKIDDVRIELKDDLRAVLRISSLLAHN